MMRIVSTLKCKRLKIIFQYLEKVEYFFLFFPSDLVPVIASLKCIKPISQKTFVLLVNLILNVYLCVRIWIVSSDTYRPGSVNFLYLSNSSHCQYFSNESLNFLYENNNNNNNFDQTKPKFWSNYTFYCVCYMFCYHMNIYIYIFNFIIQYSNNLNGIY